MNKEHTASSKKTSRGFFITATDTGIGKTVVTAALALAMQQKKLNVGVMKPIESGVHPSHIQFFRCRTTTNTRDTIPIIRINLPLPFC